MSEFTEVKTSDLVGSALDWAVGQIDPMCAGLRWEVRDGVMLGVCSGGEIDGSPACFVSEEGFVARFQIARKTESICYSPSTDWRQGGPLIEKCAPTLTPFSMSFGGTQDYWVAQPWDERALPIDGPTPLIAACRAIVASVLGDTVSVPKELV